MKQALGYDSKQRKTSDFKVSLLLITACMSLLGCRNDVNSLHTATVPITLDKPSPVSFWVATDLHYLDPGLHDGGEAFQTYVSAGDGKQLPYINELTDAFIYEAQQHKPDFIILSGDLTNNGERTSHEELSKKLTTIEESGTAVYVIPGNHDLLNPWARAFKENKQLLTDSISDKDFVSMYGPFGFDEALSTDPETLSYAVRAAPGLWLLMIDSSQYLNNRKFGFPQTDGRVASSTLSWIDECVKLAAREHASIITVLHHNVLDHTSMPVSGFKVNNSQETLTKLQSNGLNLTLSGHIHMQDIRKGTSDKNKAPDLGQNPLYDIATSAFAVNPHHYGDMNYNPDTGMVNYKAVSVDVEGWAKATGNKDPNLIHFKSFAEDSFAEGSYKKAYSSLSGSKYSEDQKQSMAESMASLNVRYFAGTVDSYATELREMPGFKLWNESTEGFLSVYIKSMLEAKELNNTALQIPLTKR